MALEISDLSTKTFSTTRAADDICGKLTRKVGWPHRYVAARLAIARSLSVKALPPLLTEEERDDMATALRDMQLFGEGVDQAAWLSLIVQRSGDRKSVDGITRVKFSGMGLCASQQFPLTPREKEASR